MHMYSDPSGVSFKPLALESLINPFPGEGTSYKHAPKVFQDYLKRLVPSLDPDLIQSSYRARPKQRKVNR